jgi:HPt (histidine-containing phosphotransfer) domain-containing protein
MDSHDAPTIASTRIGDMAQTDNVPIIDMETFQQILELDEDETRDFSAGMVWAYFQQASSTFDDMSAALYVPLPRLCPLVIAQASSCRASKDLLQLSSLGHFLKGSSAALGVSKVQAACEKIQHYGKLWDDQTGESLSEAEALKKIEPLLKIGKKEFVDAERWLKDWYADQGIDGPPAEED